MSHIVLPLAVIAVTLLVLGWLLVCVRKFMAIRAKLEAADRPPPRRAMPHSVHAPMSLAAE